MERINPRYQTSSSPLLAEQLRRNANEPKLPLPAPKLHWTQELKEENKALKEALDYLLFQMRVVVQSRFDKYRNAKDTEHSMAYRKAVQEIDLRLGDANDTVQEILDREIGWDGRGFYPTT